MPTPDPRDEGRHSAGGTELWNESYYLDWFAPDGSLGGYLRMGFLPNLGCVWYWACLVGPDRPLVMVVDHEVAVPGGGSLEVRHDGLWAELTVEEPLERMGAQLESFALAVEDPTEMYRPEPRGDRVPFGFDLEWETDGAAYLWPPVTERYEIPCRVAGEVQVGADRLVVDGWGQRDHSWGAARDWWSMPWCWSAGRLDDGTRWHSAGGFGSGVDFGVGYSLPSGSAAFVEDDVVLVSQTPGPEGLVESARVGTAGLELDISPTCWAPVLLTSPDGRTSWFPRSLSTVRSNDGRDGRCWIEFNQPSR